MSDITCPTCGEAVRWKYLKAPRCMKCDPPRAEEGRIAATEDVWKQLERMRLELTDNTHIQRPLLEAMIDQHKAVVEERDAALAYISRVKAAWQRYEAAEYLSDEEIRAEEELYALMEETP